MKNRYHFVLAITIMALSFTSAIYRAVVQTPVNTANPILFVTQVPVLGDFISVNAVFGNHQPTMQNAGRGGDLYIRYSDGTLKNLTAAAGYDGPADLVANARQFDDRLARNRVGWQERRRAIRGRRHIFLPPRASSGKIENEGADRREIARKRFVSKHCIISKQSSYRNPFAGKKLPATFFWK